MFTPTTQLAALVALSTVPLAKASTEMQGMSPLRGLEVMSSPPLFSCYIENGYDYVGNDLTSIPGAPDTCCNACNNVPGCKAWSWSGHNGGTCWLKSKRGDVVVNPNVKSALFRTGPPLPVCEMAPDVDYVGTDLARVPSGDFTGCCEKCHNYPGCRAYTWSDYLGGSCWLKSKVTSTVPKVGVKSAHAYPLDDPQPQQCTIAIGVDFIGNDIGNRPAATYEACCDICRSVNGCRAYTWTMYNGGTCWLKSKKGTQFGRLPGGYSGQAAPNPPATCAIEENLDYVGNDYANAPGANSDVCCQMCSERPGCGAFTWSNHNGGTCWLKSGKGATAIKAGVRSGLVVA